MSRRVRKLFRAGKRGGRGLTLLLCLISAFLRLFSSAVSSMSLFSPLFLPATNDTMPLMSKHGHGDGFKSSGKAKRQEGEKLSREG